MKCPYCQKGMRFGHISASNVLAWTPDGESAAGFTRWARSENSVLLGKWYGLVDASVDAYLCDDCRMYPSRRRKTKNEPLRTIHKKQIRSFCLWY